MSGVERLFKIAHESADNEAGKEEGSPIRRCFSLSSPSGRQIYKQVSDDALIEELKCTAVELGHSPSQREIFWVLREYIKERFGKWPYALKAAGLDKGAGPGGKSLERQKAEAEEKEALMEKLRDIAIRTGRMPHPSDMSEDDRKKLRKYAESWKDVLKEAGTDRKFLREKAVWHKKGAEDSECIKAIYERAKALNRPPLPGEIDAGVLRDAVELCGSWRNALYQVGLEPVERISPFSSTDTSGETVNKNHKASLYDCVYTLISTDEETKRDIAYIKAITDINGGKPPNKTDVPDELRKRLVEKCGSWTNALYQAGLGGEI